MKKSNQVFQQYTNALSRLKEVANMDFDEIIRDSAIQRFEFTLDLAWKLIKAHLSEEMGIDCSSPKECFRAAFQNNLIEYDEKWMELVDMRNLTSHTYQESLAQKIYEKLDGAIVVFEKLQATFSKIQQETQT